MEISLFDLIIFTVLGLSAFMGLYKGFIKSLLSLISSALLIIMSYLGFDYIKIIVSKYVIKNVLANIISGLLSFLISLIITSVINAKFLDFIKEIRGGAIDRIFGIFFGIIRGMAFALIIFAAVIVITTEDFTNQKNIGELVENINHDKFPDWLKLSISYKLLNQTGEIALGLLPKDFIEKNILNINLFQIDKSKNVSEALKKKAELKLKIDDEEEYFGK